MNYYYPQQPQYIQQPQYVYYEYFYPQQFQQPLQVQEPQQFQQTLQAQEPQQFQQPQEIQKQIPCAVYQQPPVISHLHYQSRELVYEPPQNILYEISDV